MNAAVSLPSSLPSRRLRRRTALVYAAGLGTVLLMSLLALLLPPAGPVRIAMLSVYILGVLCTTWSSWQLSRPAMQGLSPGPARPLDERQQFQVTQSLATAYRILGALLTVGVLVLVFGGEAVLARIRTAHVGPGLTFVVMFLVAFLPSAILAWTEPEPDREP